MDACSLPPRSETKQRTTPQRAMSLSCFFNPHHGCVLQADGHGEVWADWNSTSKFFQYGWRCTTNEDAYSNKTLLGNWNQERYDLRKMLQPKPLPSQYGHYFESTYTKDYSKEVPHSTKRKTREPHWFPGHQPELEPPPIKPTARSCYMIDYESPYGSGPCLLPVGKPKEPEGTPLSSASGQTWQCEGPPQPVLVAPLPSPDTLKCEAPAQPVTSPVCK